MSLLQLNGQIAAELASLCALDDASAVRQFFEHEKVSSAVVGELLHQAILKDQPRVVACILRSGATANLNAAVTKDGKTLLHVAVAKKNLVAVKCLLEAGPKLTVADKKGVRAVDTATWTDVWYPALGCPLQNAIFKLEQRNEALENATRDLEERAGKIAYVAEMIELETEENHEHLEASRRYKQSLEDQIKQHQEAIVTAGDEIRSKHPLIGHLKDDIERTKATISHTMERLDHMKASTIAITNETEALRQCHATQNIELGVAHNRSTVKCELIQTTQRFSQSSKVQRSFVAALLIMCLRLTAVRKLSMGGLQSRLLDILRVHATDTSLCQKVMQVLILLLDMKDRYPEDAVLKMYMKPWPTMALIISIEEVVQESMTSGDDAAVTCSMFATLLSRACQSPTQFDVTASELVVLIRSSAQRIRDHQWFQECGNITVTEAVVKLTRR